MRKIHVNNKLIIISTFTISYKNIIQSRCDKKLENIR